MFNAIKNGGSFQGDAKNLLIQSPIIWIRFFGWFSSGVGVGWAVRDLMNSPLSQGAINWLMITAMVSQFSIVIYPLLRSTGAGLPFCISATEVADSKGWASPLEVTFKKAPKARKATEEQMPLGGTEIDEPF